MFCNKGAKDFNAYFIATNSLQADGSKRSFVVRFLWQLRVPDSFSEIAPIAKLLVSEKGLFWVKSYTLNGFLLKKFMLFFLKY